MDTLNLNLEVSNPKILTIYLASCVNDFNSDAMQGGQLL